MLKVEFVYPNPIPPIGIKLTLTMKEAFKLRAFLSGATKLTDPDGTIANILGILCQDNVLGKPIG